MSTFATRLIALCLLFCAAVLLVGCEAKTAIYPVQGKVISTTGVSPTFGTVEFRSVADGRIASGQINHHGTFSLTTNQPNDGAVVGEHEVILVRVINLEDGRPLLAHGHAVEIPQRFASYETSGLTATVEPSRQNAITIEFDPAE